MENPYIKGLGFNFECVVFSSQACHRWRHQLSNSVHDIYFLNYCSHSVFLKFIKLSFY